MDRSMEINKLSFYSTQHKRYIMQCNPRHDVPPISVCWWWMYVFGYNGHRAKHNWIINVLDITSYTGGSDRKQKFEIQYISLGPGPLFVQLLQQCMN